MKRVDLHLLPVAVAVLLASLLTWACNTSGCTDNANAIPLAGFYDATTGSAVAFSGLQIGAVDAPNDTLLVDSTSIESQVYLPLLSYKPITSFYIRYKQSGISPAYYDTLTLTTQATPWFTSEECGATFRYLITCVQWTQHILQDVVVVDSLVTNVDMEYLKLYFNVANADDEDDDEDE